MFNTLALKLLKSESISIEDLTGEHTLTGVEEYYDDSRQEFCLVLDGITFSFVEDENDGYRSCLGEVFVGQREVKNTFPPVEVEVIYNNAPDTDCIVGMVDGHRVIFEVGTDYTEDYYPCFVASFRGIEK